MGYYDSVYSEELPHRAISVYMYLKERADKKSQCFPAMSTIAEKQNSAFGEREGRAAYYTPF